MSEIPAERPVTVIFQQPQRPGLLAGAIGCVLGFIGIFGPLGMLCAVIGVVAGVIGRSGTGIGVSLLAGVLSFVAAIKSPILWVIFGATMLASLFHLPPGAPQPTTANAATGAQVVATAPASVGPLIGVVNGHEAASADGLSSVAPAIPTATADNSQALAQLNHAIDWVAHFDDRAQSLVGQLDATADRYHAITTQMENDAARQQSLWPMHHIQRGQLATAISQRQAATEQLHNQVISLRAGFDRDVTPSSDKLHKMLADCQAPSLAADMASACSQLATAAQPFDDRYAALLDSLNKVEAAYQQEQPRQQALVDALPKS